MTQTPLSLSVTIGQSASISCRSRTSSNVVMTQNPPSLLVTTEQLPSISSQSNQSLLHSNGNTYLS
ncbi:hypothetical protein U0070_005278 [Myodes glareolus]|uniref:Uncharacterized protein n=1 Tax=Myodes glareolus TaxID=447135 RepID=A0AAW0GWN3_MYOGA